MNIINDKRGISRRCCLAAISEPVVVETMLTSRQKEIDYIPLRNKVIDYFKQILVTDHNSFTSDPSITERFRLTVIARAALLICTILCGRDC
ncbi:hypothetical protein ACFQW4_08245 [Pantoea sp. GCM10028869]|uniref:hypothetical protein n=1 Tax=Pantoea sp. GCM10028869 TaxID=3273417 RepID=UPI00360A936C